VHWSRFASAALLLACAGAAAQVPGASVAWLRDGGVETLALDRGPAPDARTRVPLGSLWKLFVFAYLADTAAQEPPYRCQEGPAADPEDVYCCKPGAAVSRAAALAKSCAPYFSPQRLALAPAAWRVHWLGVLARAHRTAGDAAASRAAADGRPADMGWLLDLARLRPDTLVPLPSLLAALGALSDEARADAREALLAAAVDGYGRDALPALGTGLRYKTYSWHREDGSAFGGAAGWLADGTPFWFGARGSSRTALAAWARPLAASLPAPRRDRLAERTCVDVDFFARYPIREVLLAGSARHAAPGALRGRYRIRFDNGVWLTVASRGELQLSDDGPAPRIAARLPLNDYVARVVEREGSAQPPEAGRALAIAARSYLLQNAAFDGGCWRIADSTRTQRVSPNPPGDAALAAAWFSDGLVLRGAPVRYHLDAGGQGRMSWQEAVAQARAGDDAAAILARAFPQATLAAIGGASDCERMDAAERWLAQASAAWRRRLQGEPGFEAPAAPVVVCMLAEGVPYSDQQRLRIYARGWRSVEERITLAHEYLHLALRFHPNGADEDYVERLARLLIQG